MIKWLVAIVVLSGSTANAEDAMTHVQVKFVFDAHELTRLWEPSDFTTHETTLAAHIDEVLSIGPFRAWSISPDSSTHQVVLSFRLTDESLGLGFEIDAEGDRGRLLAATMKEPWLTATEFSRKVPYPQEEAVDDIKAALDDLLEKHRTS
ncbi:MAG: hypothetical protein O7F71_16445, partial [Gammaproteobacteria bacterium]|nr:hypothetical protein [Gammaproteobacteria bacterium]